MDLRDIQRLHAQFAPDMLTIDLPRQIAALPGPSDMVVKDVSPTMRRRWIQTGPMVRGSIIALGVAAIVGMAGMGAATLYRTLRHVSAPGLADAPTQSASTPPTVGAAAAPAATPVAHTVKLKDIDAAPAQPLINAQGLNLSDITGTLDSGMTADQFRKSLKTGAAPNGRLNLSPPTASLAIESERAAVSPIHRNAPRQNVASVIAPTVAPVAITSVAAATVQSASTAPGAPAAKSPEPVVVQQVPQQVGAVSSAQASPQPEASAPVPGTAGTPGAVAKITHQARRHVPKPRLDSDSAEPNVLPRAVTPSAPASRGGSNEVQMF